MFFLLFLFLGLLVGHLPKDRNANGQDKHLSILLDNASASHVQIRLPPSTSSTYEHLSSDPSPAQSTFTRLTNRSSYVKIVAKSETKKRQVPQTWGNSKNCVFLTSQEHKSPQTSGWGWLRGELQRLCRRLVEQSVLHALLLSAKTFCLKNSFGPPTRWAWKVFNKYHTNYFKNKCNLK